MERRATTGLHPERVPRPMPSFDVTRFLDAWRRRDFDRVLDMHADGLTLEVPLLGQISRGKEHLARRMEMAAAHISELTLDARRVVQQGRDVAALLHMGVRYAGQVPTPDGELDVDGKTLALDVALFLAADDAGRVVEETWVYDVASAARQLGFSWEHLEQMREEWLQRERATPT